jgi:uncharacterized protein (DUF2062 family)
MFKRRQHLGFFARLRSYLWPRKGPARTWSYLWHRIRRIRSTPHSIALGLAIGAFISFSPLIGFHVILATIVSAILRGNVLAAAAATTLCNPLTCAPMMIANYHLGVLILREKGRTDFTFDVPDATLTQLITHPAHVVGQLVEALSPVVLPMFLGSALLGISIAVPFYIVARFAIASYQRRRKERLKSHAFG